MSPAGTDAAVGRGSSRGDRSRGTSDASLDVEDSVQSKGRGATAADRSRDGRRSTPVLPGIR
jgi:hypothetical protein